MIDMLGTETVSVWPQQGATPPQAFNVCVMASASAEPFSESAIDSQREALAFIFCEDDWRSIQLPRRGDTIKRSNPTRTYRIESVKRDDALGIVIEARSVE